MNWRKIKIKFTGNCITCNKPINSGEIGLWAKDIGVKHIKCVDDEYINCIICKAQVFCSKCEFRDHCNTQVISQCICQNCITKDKLMNMYKKSLQNIKI